MNRNVDEFLQSFMYFYRLMGKNKDVFFEQLMKEINQLKENENINNNNFIQVFKEELKNLQEKENTLKTETEKIQIEPKQEIKSIDTPANQTQEIMENTNTPAKTFVLPFPKTHFKSTLKKNINEFIKQAQESSENNQKLLELNIIKDIDLSGNSPKVFSRKAILPQEKINDFAKDYAKSYLKTLSNEIGVGMEFLGFNVKGDILLSSKINLSQTDFSEMIKSKQINSNDLGFHWDWNIGNIQNYQKESKAFIDNFQYEIKDLSNHKDLSLMPENIITQNNQNPNPISKDNSPQTPSGEKLENSNQPNQSNDKSDVAPLLDFFDKLKIQNEQMAIGKDQFKKEFLIYSKTQMKENEMKVLLKLLNKEPSRLTAEHQKLIKSGLAYALGNQNLLDKDLGLTIKNQLKIELNPDEKQYLEQKNLEHKKAEIQLKSGLTNQTLSNSQPNSKTNAKTSKKQTNFGMGM
ncbi:hypothetical protein BKH41_09435 [Helicobacter sp. 12S02232-10]|uniref:hypothetical protein n=1 Tax=Helicobacter sp. 12S02232-10 TaxID=1476197 RepID=UPI000BA4FB96|nr:hypothetical protein [Helicobacter sp. 12S02232-10]PAF46198.1 hypothetical protein BKH41_09435 [Helicobacter sp. 12S02232-10]